MSRQFDPIAYVTQVGQDLESAFQIAGFATTVAKMVDFSNTTIVSLF